MKNLVIVILLLAALALGVFGWRQYQQLAQTRADLAASRKQLQERSATGDQAAFAEKRSRALQQALTETSALAKEKSKQAEQLQQSLAAAKTNNPLQGMADVLKDPKMRD